MKKFLQICEYLLLSIAVILLILDITNWLYFIPAGICVACAAILFLFEDTIVHCTKENDSIFNDEDEKILFNSEENNTIRNENIRHYSSNINTLNEDYNPVEEINDRKISTNESNDEQENVEHPEDSEEYKYLETLLKGHVCILCFKKQGDMNAYKKFKQLMGMPYRKFIDEGFTLLAGEWESKYNMDAYHVIVKDKNIIVLVDATYVWVYERVR